MSNLKKQKNFLQIYEVLTLGFYKIYANDSLN